VTGGSSSSTRFMESIGDRLDGSPLAIVLDIDGTLAPIAPTPDAAIVPPETRDAVSRLAGIRGVHVALVSGRTVADALRMVPGDAAWIVGNHGLELRPPGGEVSAVQEAHIHEDAIARASRALAPMVGATPGALLDDKRWTLCVHYRQVEAARVPALIEHTRAVARELGLRVTQGKKIIELRPPIDFDKGTAAVAFARHVGALEERGSILVVGDDLTDEDAFRALRAHSARAVAVRIRGSPTEHTAETAAEFELATTDELRATLDWLADRRDRLDPRDR
jgi:trehalose-phosphatase